MLLVFAEQISKTSGLTVSVQTICHTLCQVNLHRQHSRHKPLLNQVHKKACKQFAEARQSKPMTYWQHVLWSDKTKINLFGSDGNSLHGNDLMNSTKKTVLYLQSNMVLVLYRSNSLMELWIPPCTVTF